MPRLGCGGDRVRDRRGVETAQGAEEEEVRGKNFLRHAAPWEGRRGMGGRGEGLSTRQATVKR